VASVCMRERTSSGWLSPAAPPEATPVAPPQTERDIYVRGIRHGFVAALWLSIAVAAVAVIIYTLAADL
jgi:hypothetical protein